MKQIPTNTILTFVLLSSFGCAIPVEIRPTPVEIRPIPNYQCSAVIPRSSITPFLGVQTSKERGPWASQDRISMWGRNKTYSQIAFNIYFVKDDDPDLQAPLRFIRPEITKEAITIEMYRPMSQLPNYLQLISVTPPEQVCFNFSHVEFGAGTAYEGTAYIFRIGIGHIRSEAETPLGVTQ